jgi:hypothetical protein
MGSFMESFDKLKAIQARKDIEKIKNNPPKTKPVKPVREQTSPIIGFGS